MTATLPAWTADDMQAFLDRNGFASPADLRPFDATQRAALDWGNADPEAGYQAALAHRRLYNLTGDLALGERLQSKGFHSAFQVATVAQRRFVEEVAPTVGLDADQAKALYQRAVGIQGKTFNLMAAVHGAVAQPHFRSSRVANVGDDIPTHFEDLPSYQELFGSLDYCSCEECKSIFGPAAYLVDLMRIIDEYITAPNTSATAPNPIPAPFRFDARRPDIAQIPLTCDMTNDLVPYLQIVTERLAATACSLLHFADTPALQQAMATTIHYPLNLPFNEPLDQIRVLVQQFALTLGSIYQAWAVDSDDVVREQSGLSPEQWTIAKTAQTTADGIAPFYNTKTASLPDLTALDSLMDATGLSVTDLQQLIIQGLSSAEIGATPSVATQLFVNTGLGNNYLTWVEDQQGNVTIPTLSGTPSGLNIVALDQMNRLRRLASTVGWNPSVTDWLLRAVKNGQAPTIDPAALQSLVQVQQVAAQLQLSPLQAAVLFGPIKTYGDDGAGGPSPFDQLFNTKAQVAKGRRYHPRGNPLNPLYKDPPLPWAPGQSNDPSVLLRVASGLGLNLSDLDALGVWLYGNRPQEFNVDTLSTLYRHASVSRALKLSMNAYLIFLDLLGQHGKAVFVGSDLEPLLASWQWMVGQGMNPYQLQYVLTGTPSVYVNPLLDPNQLPTWLAGVTRSIPPTDPDAASKLDAQIAVFFSADQETTTALRTLAISAVTLPTGCNSWTDAFLAPIPAQGAPPYLPYVTSVMGGLARGLVYTQATNVSADVLACVARNPSSFGLSPKLSPLTLDNLEDIQSFYALIGQFGDQRGDLIAYVDGAAQTTPPPDLLDTLQDATGWDPAQVTLLLSKEVKDVANVVDRLQQLSVCFSQIATLGGNVSTLRELAALATAPATQWSTYTAQASLLTSTISRRFGEAQWNSPNNPVTGKLLVHTRDARLGVVQTALNALYTDVTTPNNVYEFLLCDVESGPEAQISYIKEALNAAQLFLQRCRLRLEPGVEIIDIPEIWWEWILNYRVWEANRQIFVYPENYLLPSVRQDKTTLFQTLENDLLQSQVTTKYVESAYTNYIQSLLVLSDLQPVEAFSRSVYDDGIGGTINAFYLFARTSIAPYTYYMCRQVEGEPWSEWQKISLTIDSPYVTATYAFHKLFLFWVKLDTTIATAVTSGSTSGAIVTNVDTSYQATIQYSFLDRSGQWVAPQTLAQDLTVLFDGEGPDAIQISGPGGTTTLLANDPAFDGVFDMSQLAWHKVFVLHASGTNLEPGLPTSADPERLVVLYGPSMAPSPTTISVESVVPPSKVASAFAETLVARASAHDRMLEDFVTGQLPFCQPYVIDASLQTNILVHRAETLLTDPVMPQGLPSTFRPGINDLTGALQIAASGTPIQDLYLGDQQNLTGAPPTPSRLNAQSFISDTITPTLSGKIFSALTTAGILNATTHDVVPAQLSTQGLYKALRSLLTNEQSPAEGQLQPFQLQEVASILLVQMGAPSLFGATNVNQATVVTVKGQPGSFLYNNGDETFLVNPVIPKGSHAFPTLDKGLTISQPPLHPGSFVSTGATTPLTYANSRQVFRALQTYGFLDGNGFVQLGQSTWKNLNICLNPLVGQLTITQDQINPIIRTVLNYPVVPDNAFVSDNISLTLSQLLHRQLVTYGLLDANQRVALDLLNAVRLNQALVLSLQSNQIGPKDIPGIYRALLTAPVPIVLSYSCPQAPTTMVTNGQFTVTRLTTAVVPILERALFTGGIKNLLSLATQDVPVFPLLAFDRLQPVANRIVWPTAVDGAQVDFDGLYGRYFWELFYHGPMLVANSLAANQQFQQALTWFQYIFNPSVLPNPVVSLTFSSETNQAIDPTLSALILTALQTQPMGSKTIVDDKGWVNTAFTTQTDLSFLKQGDVITDAQIILVRNVLLNHQLATPASRFWQFFPFRMHTLETLTQMLSDVNADGQPNQAMLAYNNHPFDPFAIARLRIGAFEKATVMQYIDVLIQWGDYYFTQDTWESITAATMLYVYASDILGPRPQQVGVCRTGDTATYQTIRDTYAHSATGIPQFLLYLESTLPPTQGNGGVAIQAHGFNDLGTYFGVPENTQLTSYWERVDDRLSKIRHSENIEGVYRQLALFEPPLNPMDLIRAAASGGSVLPPGGPGQDSPPPQRFAPSLALAMGLTETVVQLGNDLLAALEKKDGEALAVLRNTQEGQILALNTQVQEQAITEMESNLASLQANLSSATYRLNFYTTLIKNDLSSSELTNLSSMAAALGFNVGATVVYAASAAAYTIPQVGSPFAMTYGGIQVGSMLQAVAVGTQIGADVENFRAQRSLTMAGYERRTQDWTLQENLAQYDVESITNQIAATQAQLNMAKQQLVINQKQIAQNAVIDQYLTNKFTNADLYLWMAGRLSVLYFQTYNLALSAARNAQAAYRYELGSSDTFLDFDYWDNLHKGLVAGQGLRLALNRMQAAYATNNTRKLEITRTISLAQLNPGALDLLRTTGTCSFDLPELLFDYDYPGHYQRQISTLSLSIPAVIGPYENLRATLVQTKNAVALKPTLDAVNYLINPNTGSGVDVRVNLASNQMVAISRGLDDSGLFVVDFHDERYLPFEGTGTVSSWTLSMPLESNRFDFSQLSDVILNLGYTSRSDGTLQQGVIQKVLPNHPLMVGYYIDVQQQDPIAWQAFMNDHNPQTPNSQTLSFTFQPNWLGKLKAMTLTSLAVRLSAAFDLSQSGSVTNFATLTIGSQPAQTLTLNNGVATLGPPTVPVGPNDTWQLAVNLTALSGNTTLKPLIKGGWLDPTQCLDLEAVLSCQVLIY